jgi:hypothetical protein
MSTFRLNPRTSAFEYRFYTQARIKEQDDERRLREIERADLEKARDLENKRAHRGFIAQRQRYEIVTQIIQENAERRKFTVELRFGPHGTICNRFDLMDDIRAYFRFHRVHVFYNAHILSGQFEFCDPYLGAFVLVPRLCPDVLRLVLEFMI